MNRKSFQSGYISDPVETSRGIRVVIRWRARRPGGRWKQRSETLYDVSRKVAQATLRDRIRESAEAKPEPQGGGLTLKQFIEAYWKPYLVDRRKIKTSTLEGYNSLLKDHVLPTLGDIRITDVRPLDIEQLLKSRSSLAPKTLRNLLGVVGGIFSLAVDNDLIGKSPVRDKHKPTVPRREKLVWTAEQVRAIIAAAPKAYRALFACAALTGARLGELLALQWKHINFEQGKLRIAQSLWHGRIVPPKTEGSVRTIVMGQVLPGILREHLGNSLHTRPGDFVFCKPDGRPLDPGVLRRDVLYPVLGQLGIPRLRRASGFHVFRHVAGSLVVQETGNLKLAQRLLGHSNIGTTGDIYTHLSEQSEREAALAVERQIYGDLFLTCSSKGETGNRNKSAAVN